MKFTLKLVLFLCLVVAGIYATIPFWLPYALERQLPPGWKLESMEAGYPGLSSIDIHSLRLKGPLTAADLGIRASDLRISYRSKEVEIDSASLSVNLQALEENPAESLALNTLVFNLTSFRLSPREDGSFSIATNASLEGFPQAAGYIEADAGRDLLEADIRFPAALDAPAWLAMKLVQRQHPGNTSTMVEAVFDTEPADQEWVDWLLVQATDGFLTRAQGRLEVSANLSGSEMRDIESLSLRTEELNVVTTSGPLAIKAGLTAGREGGNIVVKASSPAEIQYEDQAGVIDQLFTDSFPELRRAPRTDAVLAVKPGSASRVLIKQGANPSIRFEGPVTLDLTADGETIHMESDRLIAQIRKIPEWATLSVDGLIRFEWQEDAGLAYRSEDLELKTEELSATGEIMSRDGKYISKGSATLSSVEVTEPAITAETVEMNWQDLDLLKVTGRLGTRTRGLSIAIDGETWSGFDLEAEYRLIDGVDFKGRGELMFDDGLSLPIMFSGNSDTNEWDITFRRATIDMPRLTNLLGLADIKLPDEIKLTDGLIGIQGQVKIDDDITARMDITGSDIDISMLESHADDARFSFTATYDDEISVTGPVSIESVGLAGGVDVSNIRADLRLIDTDIWRLENISAGLFDGRLSLNQLQYSEDSLQDATLELNDISLGRLLEYADFDGLNGSGTLDMSLPVSIDRAGANISNGLFRSSVPGFLAYTKEGVAGSNIGMQALENFQYKDLSGEINYQSDGSYHVKVHLEGNNPDLYDGHPVDFNLNINGSLPKLFEALLITGDFEEAILDEVRNN